MHHLPTDVAANAVPGLPSNQVVDGAPLRVAPSGFQLPVTDTSTIIATPVKSSASENTLSRLLSKRDWKFYLAVTVPPLLLASLGLWYWSSSSSATRKAKSKRRSKKSALGNKEGTKTTGSEATPTGKNEPSEDNSADRVNPATLDEAAIAALSEEQRKEYALNLKSKGNKYYGGRQYEKAIDLYTQALRFVEDPVFYANRAACYNELDQPLMTIGDCNKAIELKPSYTKALIRRATAYEKSHQYKDAMEDFTLACILDEFKNHTTAASAERTVRKYAEIEAKQQIKNRSYKLPSPTFISAFMASYRPDPTIGEPPADLDSEPTGVQAYWKAQEQLAAKNYPGALEAVQEALTAGCGPHEARALTLRGTLYFLMGDTNQALENFDRALELDPNHIPTYLKKANVYTERQRIMDTIGALEAASQVPNSDQTEVHYQKGQVFFISNEFEHAIKEFEEAIKLDPTFIFPYIQLAVCQYKNGNASVAEAKFHEILAKFPDNSDVYNYYAEILADQRKFDEALTTFDKAVELDPDNAVAMVNKALMLYQWQHDAAGAMKLVETALTRDPDCEVAIATASQICLQLGHFSKALDYLTRAVELAKSEEEIISAITIRESTKTQIRILRENPELVSKMATSFNLTQG
ncbi:TOM (translocase of outer membrane) complex component [Dispira simplex]|nr:TOM (translocase of outer membrane) complex component [Dispira simplex]